MKVLSILLFHALIAGYLCKMKWPTKRPHFFHGTPTTPRPTRHTTPRPRIWCADEKWKRFDSKSHVALVKEPKGWQDARRYCEALGGHLANLFIDWGFLFLQEMPGYDPRKDYWFGNINWTYRYYSNWKHSAAMLKSKPPLIKTVKVAFGDHHLMDTNCTSKRPFICQAKTPCFLRPALSINDGQTLENKAILLQKYTDPKKISVECVQLGSTSFLTTLRLVCDSGLDWEMSQSRDNVAIVTVNERMPITRCWCYLHQRYMETRKSYVRFFVRFRLGVEAMKTEEEKSYELFYLVPLVGAVAGICVLVSAVAYILAIYRKRDAERTTQDGGVPSVPTDDA